MPVKRRIRNSSNNLAAPVATAAAPSPKLLKPSIPDTAMQSRPRILTVASPVVQQSHFTTYQQTIGGFLERCHYCKNNIAMNSEVFMYCDFCAFCSLECREFQISLDQLAEKQSEQTIWKVVPGLGINIVKGHLVSYK